MAKITMAATAEVEHADGSHVDVEIEVESEPGEDSAKVGIALAGAIAAMEAIKFGTEEDGEPAPDTGGPSAPMT